VRNEKEYSAVAKRFRAPLAALAIVPVAVAAAACSSSSNPSTSPSSSSSATSSSSSAAIPTAPASSAVTLSETGSTLLYPLFNEWAPAYKSQYSQVTISTAGTGSGTGISDAAAGTVDIGASDAYLSSGQMGKSPNLENIPLAISAQQVNYNLPGVKNLKLNGAVLAGIYGGAITTWNNPVIKQLNPGVTLPSTKIIPIRRSESSGDTFLFTSYLSSQVPQWKNSIGMGTTVAWPNVSSELAEKGNSGMVTGCKANPGCIAYIGISYESKTTAAGLGQAELANGAGGYAAPTASSVSAAASSFVAKTPASGTISMINSSASGAYPIVNYEYGIVSTSQSNSAKAQTLKAFLHWAITTGNGSTYLSKVNFQPLPSSVVSISDALIAKIS
jgi:phosphate transport system substrate-binding protein